MRSIHIHVCNFANTCVRYVSRANTHRPYVRTQAICPAYPLCDDNEHHVIVVVSIGIVVADVMVVVVVEVVAVVVMVAVAQDRTASVRAHADEEEGISIYPYHGHPRFSGVVRFILKYTVLKKKPHVINIIRDRDTPPPAPALKHAVEVHGAARSLLDEQKQLRRVLLLLRSGFSS